MYIYIYIYICIYIYTTYILQIFFILQKLDKVKNNLNDCSLVTFDVKSLYTKALNNEGIKAVREAYDNHSTKTVVTKVIITFLSLTVTLNNLRF